MLGECLTRSAFALPPPVALQPPPLWGGKDREVAKNIAYKITWVCLPWGRCHAVTEGVNVRLYNEILVNTSQRRSMRFRFHVRARVHCLCTLSLDNAPSLLQVIYVGSFISIISCEINQKYWKSWHIGIKVL